MAGGLDKGARLRKEQAEEEAKKRQRVKSLDPKFPYKVVAFTPLFFRVPRAKDG